MHQALQLDVALVGLSTKIHAVVDALGNPVSFHLTPGQACDLYRQGGRGHSSRGSKPFLPAVERSGTGVSSPVLEGRLGLGGVQAPSNPPPCSPLPAKSASGSDLDGADVLLPDLRTDHPPETWQDIPLASSWSNYGTDYVSAQCCKLVGSLIEVRGTIKKSTAVVVNEVVATLPIGYRPSATMYFVTWA
jgi:hypothetical protein